MRICSLTLISVLCAIAAETARPVETELDQGYRHMYNREFAEAHRSFAEWQGRHPEDPLMPASDAAAYLFSEFDRMHILQSEFFTHDQHFITDHKLTPDPALKRKFEAALDAARRLSARAPTDPNSMFAALLASGLHSDYLALVEKRYAASFQEMKAARLDAERLLAADPDYCDAWVAVGVENYMLSVKPAPVRWLLRLAGGETDRALGVQKLKLAAEKGHYLAPFARLLLAVASLRDKDVGRARDLLEGLTREYPNNQLYVQELARMRPATPAVDAAGVSR
jgi:tetratricopeptide (TPR) repeat protein